MRWVFVVIPLLTLRVAPAAAAVVVAVPLEQMARESEVIVDATVEAQVVAWDARRQRVLTFSTLRVHESWRGGARPGETVSVFQVGGSLDGWHTRVPGAITLRRGERVVFFGTRFREHVVSYGVGLGKYRVVASGADEHVVPEYGEVAFVTRAPDGALRASPAPELHEPLSRFAARVRAALRVAP